LRIIFKVTKELPRGSNFSAQREGIRSEYEMEIRPGSQVAMDNGPPPSLSKKSSNASIGWSQPAAPLENFQRKQASRSLSLSAFLSLEEELLFGDSDLPWRRSFFQWLVNPHAASGGRRWSRRSATTPTVPEGLCSSCTFYGPVFL